MSETAAAVSGVVSVGGEEAAQIDILLINSPRALVEESIAAAAGHRA